jgi:Tfp pilus assembly protein FimT
MELILVMALLVMVVSLIMPSLKRFFAGRDVDSEVKHFIAMMHYGQSRAVAEGIPMMLWIDPQKGTYGLEQEPGYKDKDEKAVESTVAPGVTIGVSHDTVKTTLANSQTGRILAGQAGTKSKMQAIYFLPDGVINNVRSVSGVSFQADKNPAVWIVPSEAKVSDVARK